MGWEIKIVRDELNLKIRHGIHFAAIGEYILLTIAMRYYNVLSEAQRGDLRGQTSRKKNFACFYVHIIMYEIILQASNSI